MPARLLNAVAIVCGIVVVSWLGWVAMFAPPAPTVSMSAGPPPSKSVSITSAAQHGNPTAPIAVVVYSDFQCPYCARFARETLPELNTSYVARGTVRVAFRHLPLTAIHPNAMGAARAAECARRQDKFWAMHDRLFTDPVDLAPASLERHGRELGLGAPFLACLQAEESGEPVRRDLAEARSLNLVSTPTVLVGRVAADGTMQAAYRFGAVRPQELATAIDTLLAQGAPEVASR
jgi:protein-disulfide isomerase